MKLACPTTVYALLPTGSQYCDPTQCTDKAGKEDLLVTLMQERGWARANRCLSHNDFFWRMVHGRGEATTLTAYAGDMAMVRLIEAGRDRSLVHQQELLYAL